MGFIVSFLYMFLVAGTGVHSAPGLDSGKLEIKPSQQKKIPKNGMLLFLRVWNSYFGVLALQKCRKMVICSEVRIDWKCEVRAICQSSIFHSIFFQFWSAPKTDLVQFLNILEFQRWNECSIGGSFRFTPAYIGKVGTHSYIRVKLWSRVNWKDFICWDSTVLQD